MPDPDARPHDPHDAPAHGAPLDAPAAIVPVDTAPVDPASVDPASVDAGPNPAAPRGAARQRRRPRLLTHAPRLGRPWLRAATLAAAATIGALVGFGLSDGASLARLGVVTLRLRGLPEFVAPDRGATAAALLGGLHVAFVSGAWGAGAGAFGGWLQARGVQPAARGAAVAAFALLLALVDGVLPRPLRLAGGALGGVERVLVALLITAAAWGASRVSDPPG